MSLPISFGLDTDEYLLTTFPCLSMRNFSKLWCTLDKAVYELRNSLPLNPAHHELRLLLLEVSEDLVRVVAVDV